VDEVNEVTFMSDLFRHSDRLRSYELAVEATSVGEFRALWNLERGLLGRS
jgi:hypothetical protein